LARLRGRIALPELNGFFLEIAMLAPYLSDRVWSLRFEEKLSYRQIARRLRVDRKTIARITRGKEFDPLPVMSDPDDDFEAPQVPPQRCPVCGGLVYPPCRLCQTRIIIQNHIDSLARLEPVEYPIAVGLDLKPRHRRRYERVRRRRREFEAAAG
jgi:hypothetical protein